MHNARTSQTAVESRVKGYRGYRLLAFLTKSNRGYIHMSDKIAKSIGIVNAMANGVGAVV